MLKTIVIGHVGQSKLVKKPGTPEEGGFTVLNFTVASNSTTRSGKEVTNWVSCKLWGPRAEKLANHVVKGQGVAVEGRPEAVAYLSGEKAKGDLVLHVEKFEFVGGKPEGAPAGVEGDQVEPEVAAAEPAVG